MKKSILGVEIGSRAIKLVDYRNGRVAKYAQVDVPENTVSNGSLQSFEVVADILKQAVRENKISNKKVALVLAENDAHLRRLILPLMNAKQLDINLPFEFKDVITEEEDKYTFDYTLIKYINDASDTPKEIDIMAGVTNKELIEKYISMFRRAGLTLIKATPREMALRSYIKSIEENIEKKDFAILDIGYHTSKIDIFKNGDYEITTEIDAGLELVEQAIAEKLGYDIHLSPQIISLNKDNILSDETLVDVYERIAVEAMRIMNYYAFENPNSDLDTLYFCGGGSSIAQLIDEIKNTIELNIVPLSAVAGDVPPEVSMIANCALGACLD